MYQKCPVCDGTGLVSRPPGVAGDQETWFSSSSGPYPCRVCNGNGVLPSQQSGVCPECGSNETATELHCAKCWAVL